MHIRNDEIKPAYISLLGYSMVIAGIFTGLMAIFIAVLHFGAIPYDPSRFTVVLHITAGTVALLVAPLPIITGIGLLRQWHIGPILMLITGAIYSCVIVASYLQVACSFNHSLEDPCYVRSISQPSIAIPAIILSSVLLVTTTVVFIALSRVQRLSVKAIS